MAEAGGRAGPGVIREESGSYPYSPPAAVLGRAGPSPQQGQHSRAAPVGREVHTIWP